MTKVYCPRCGSSDIRIIENTCTPYLVDEDGTFGDSGYPEHDHEIYCFDCNCDLYRFFDIDWHEHTITYNPDDVAPTFEGNKNIRQLLDKLSEPLDILEKTFTPEQV